MNIAYVAKHGSGGNDDEGAVTFALEQLGHQVIRLREEEGWKILSMRNVDLLLWHKWFNVEVLRKVKCFKAFWWFDVVTHPDCSERRNALRLHWMEKMVLLADLGFLTDGDYAARFPDKLRWLPQGFDSRQRPFVRCEEGDHYDPDNTGMCAKCGTRHMSADRIPILFVGSATGCLKRAEWIEDMTARYGTGFVQVRKGCHGDALAELVSRADVVVAPPSPVTDRYWSNRIYLMLGLGAFLIHPFSQQLFDSLRPAGPIYYDPNIKESLPSLIDAYMDSPESRNILAREGRRLILEKHTYVDRCRELIRQVEEAKR